MTFSSKLTLIFLIPALAGVAYAGAGANGGQGNDTIAFTYDLVYGTISPPSGSPVDFLATTVNINIFLEDFLSGDGGTPPAVNPIVDNGATGLLALSPTSPLVLTLTPTVFTASFADELVDNIWFSNGTAGQIDPADISDPAAILSAAENLGALSGPGSFDSSSSAEGSASFSNAFSQGSPDVSGELDATIDLEQLDLYTPVTATPEPSEGWFLSGVLGALLLIRSGRRFVSSRP